MLLVALSGVLLGVLSRIEETTPFSAGISSDSTWILAAAAAGALSRRGGSSVASPRRGALAGTVVLSAANAGYYALIAVSEPGVDLASIAGPPWRWVFFGVAGGALFGLAGVLWRRGGEEVRLAAALLVGAVLIADGATAMRGGPAADAAGLVAGVALPVVSVRRLRVVALAGSLALAAVAATGVLEPLLP